MGTCRGGESIVESSAPSFAGVSVHVEDGKRVRPLYQQLFSIEDPTLIFAGLPFRVVPFPLFYFQGM
mgnify:CR=1 FL=1